MKINKTAPDEHKYLQILSHIADTPKTLYYLGELPTERQPTVAIVGTRKPTNYGKEVTQKLAGDLAKKGVIIVSGLALGVDAIAHKAALESNGKTIAVLANGLPQIYPATNQQLAKDILKSTGAIISEYPPETKARGYQFLERNRIVSGLADAVIITEAASRSGTFNTAMHALDQGKELFVVPGNITNPMSVGCNNLLKQGAAPVTQVSDILEVIAPSLLTSQTNLALGNSKEETTIIKLLQSGIRDGDELQLKSSLDASTFATTLTMMELNGVIRPLGANQWTIK